MVGEITLDTLGEASGDSWNFHCLALKTGLIEEDFAQVQVAVWNNWEGNYCNLEHDYVDRKWLWGTASFSTRCKFDLLVVGIKGEKEWVAIRLIKNCMAKRYIFSNRISCPASFNKMMLGIQNGTPRVILRVFIGITLQELRWVSENLLIIGQL